MIHRPDLPVAQKKRVLRDCIEAYGKALALAEALGITASVLSRQASVSYPREVPTWDTLVAASIESGTGTLARFLAIACGVADVPDGGES